MGDHIISLRTVSTTFTCYLLQFLADSSSVPITKKLKRDNRLVAYIRLNAKEHAQISKIAQKRGHPHTFASVAAEMISKALKMETRA